MALYAIGDLHLCLGAPKPMDVFGGAWVGYMEKLRQGMSVIGPEDTTILMGDLSWALDLESAKADFAWINQIPGRKIILKGNHDYWWSTVSKFQKFCQENGFSQMNILNNNFYEYGGYALCGTRGWFMEEDAHNVKVLNREVLRLEASLQAAEGRPIWCFLHYPPLYQGYQCPEILDTLKKYPVEQCCYGHLHGPVIKRRMEGRRGETDFSLISADYLGFQLKKICE